MIATALMEPMPVTDRKRWQAVVDRDPRLLGLFVYAVRSTGIYCRVGCPSRRPRRDRVEFFPAPALAERAGYRACRRCRPKEAAARHPHLALVERACRLLDREGAPTSLTALGAELGVSAGHLQRVFTRVVGVSPRAWADAGRARVFRRELRKGEGVSRALYAAGYGSPSRVYEGNRLGMTPATYGRGGAGARIGWAVGNSSLGRVLVGATGQGVCFVSLGRTDQELVEALAAEFPKAERERDQERLGEWLAQVVALVEARPPHGDLPLDIRATAFQSRVWQELTRIPIGETVTYQELAARIGRPKAVRAVASACARNNVAVVVPCHRVVRTDGGLGGYRWGIERKRSLLSLEQEEASKSS